MNCPAIIMTCVKIIAGTAFSPGTTAVSCPAGEASAQVCIVAEPEIVVTCSESTNMAVYQWTARSDGKCYREDSPRVKP